MFQTSDNFLDPRQFTRDPRQITRDTRHAPIRLSLDEVLLAIVYTVYSGNIITRSRLVLKVAVTGAFVALGSSVLVQRQAGSHAEGSWRSVSRPPASLVEDCCFSKIQYRYPVADPGGGSGGSGPPYQTWRLQLWDWNYIDRIVYHFLTGWFF